MVTIYDIAKVTGHSAPTVSKALTGTGTLSAKTREKIVAVAKEMGYEPNIAARTLSTKKSNLIGVIYDDTGMNRGFAHPLFSVVLNRFREQIEVAGYDIIFLSRHFKMTYYSHAQYRNVDGIIIINPATDNKEEFKDFIDNNIPIVSTNSIIKGISTVLTDNEIGGYRAAEYFIKKGHKKIAYLSAPVNEISFAAAERFEGFKRALKDYNIEFDENLYEQSKLWNLDGGYDAFHKLVERTRDFTAIFAATDLMAHGILKYCREKGISIPNDISIIGFDNDVASSLSEPGITTFEQDGVQIADFAAEILFQQIIGMPTGEMARFAPKFIERDSVKDLSIN